MSTTEFQKLSRDDLAALSPEKQAEYRKQYAKYLQKKQAKEAAVSKALNAAEQAVLTARSKELEGEFERPIDDIDPAEFKAMCTEIKMKPGLGPLKAYWKLTVLKTLEKYELVMTMTSPRGVISSHPNKRMNVSVLRHVPNEETGKLEAYIQQVFTGLRPAGIKETKDLAKWWKKVVNMGHPDLADELPPDLYWTEFGLLPTVVLSKVCDPQVLADELVKMIEQEDMVAFGEALSLSTTTQHPVDIKRIQLHFATEKDILEVGGYDEGSTDPSSIPPPTLATPANIVTVDLDPNFNVSTTGVPQTIATETVRTYRKKGEGEDAKIEVVSVKTNVKMPTGSTPYGFSPVIMAKIAAKLAAMLDDDSTPLYLVGVTPTVKSYRGDVTPKVPIHPNRFTEWKLQSYYSDTKNLGSISASLLQAVVQTVEASLTNERNRAFKVVRAADKDDAEEPKVGDTLDDIDGVSSLGQRFHHTGEPIGWPAVHASKPRTPKYVPDTDTPYEWCRELSDMANLRRQRQWFTALLKKTEDKEERAEIEAKIEELRLQMIEIREKEQHTVTVSRKASKGPSKAGSATTQVVAKVKHMVESTKRKRAVEAHEAETGNVRAVDHMPVRSPVAAAAAAVGGLKPPKSAADGPKPPKRAKLAAIGAQNYNYLQIDVNVDGEGIVGNVALDAQPTEGQIVTIKGESFKLTECFEDNAEDCTQRWFAERVEPEPQFMDDLAEDDLAAFDEE